MPKRKRKRIGPKPPAGPIHADHSGIRNRELAKLSAGAPPPARDPYCIRDGAPREATDAEWIRNGGE
jgi:hypothetical protein